MDKIQKRIRRRKRIRSKIKGNKTTPRISVFRSNKYIYIQVINDEDEKSITSLSDKVSESKKELTKTQKAFATGELLASVLIKKGFKSAVFDRSGYGYHGRVRAIAEGIRKGGIKL